MGKTAYINDIVYEVKDGETILSFVRRHLGKDFVPTLCDAPNVAQAANAAAANK